MKQGNWYKGDNGECAAISCHKPATHTLVTIHHLSDESWVLHADYCIDDVFAFAGNFLYVYEPAEFEVVGIFETIDYI